MAVVGALLSAAGLLFLVGCGEDQPRPYDVYALLYGRSKLKTSTVFDAEVRHGHRGSRVTAGWYAWVIRGNRRVVLVDTGFYDERLARKWGISRFTELTQLLARLDLTPPQITDVVLTHLHWDHAGQLPLFRRASVWIQEAEFEYAEGLLEDGAGSAHGILARDFHYLKRLAAEGTVHMVRGRQEIYPGITLQLAGDHSPGNQYVTVATASGTVVIASDSAYLYENALRQWPIGGATDRDLNLANFRKYSRVAATPWFIIPGHDPLVDRVFPRVAKGVVRITLEAGGD